MCDTETSKCKPDRTDSVSQLISRSVSYSFTSIQNAADLLPVLQERLPRSGILYNMVLLEPRFRDEVEFHTFGSNPGISVSSWIIGIYKREHSGTDAHISTPTSSEIDVSEAVEGAFGTTSIFDWSITHCFSTHEPAVSAMLVRLSKSSIKKIEGVFGVNPCTFYYYPHGEVQVPGFEADTRLERLNSDPGFEFIWRTWKYTKYSSQEYVRKILARNPSKGVWVAGNQVSGMTVSGNGAMSMLYTEPEFRGRGYGKLTMLSLIQDILESGHLPFSFVEDHNSVSKQFHESIGMKASHSVLFNYFDIV